HDREIGDRPFRPVLGDESDPVARADAEGRKPAGHMPHPAGGLGPAQRDPVLVLADPQERTIGLPRGPIEEHRGKARPITLNHRKLVSSTCFAALGFRLLVPSALIGRPRSLRPFYNLALWRFQPPAAVRPTGNCLAVLSLAPISEQSRCQEMPCSVRRPIPP